MNVTYATSHTFQIFSDLKIFPERCRGPLKRFAGPHVARGPLIAHPYKSLLHTSTKQHKVEVL